MSHFCSSFTIQLNLLIESDSLVANTTSSSIGSSGGTHTRTGTHTQVIKTNELLIRKQLACDRFPFQLNLRLVTSSAPRARPGAGPLPVAVQCHCQLQHASV